MRYILITQWNDEHAFEDKVEEYLKMGYTLVGGVSMTCDDCDNIGLAQAMTIA